MDHIRWVQIHVCTFNRMPFILSGGYAKFTGLKTYNKALKTMLAVGGWNEGSARFSPLVADDERRREFVKNVVRFLRQNHFDGLDLDWEYPAFRDGGKSKDRENYAQLVQVNGSWGTLYIGRLPPDDLTRNLLTILTFTIKEKYFGDGQTWWNMLRNLINKIIRGVVPQSWTLIISNRYVSVSYSGVYKNNE